MYSALCGSAMFDNAPKGQTLSHAFHDQSVMLRELLVRFRLLGSRVSLIRLDLLGLNMSPAIPPDMATSPSSPTLRRDGLTAVFDIRCLDGVLGFEGLDCREEEVWFGEDGRSIV